jgi:hypothetical protein
LLLLLLLLWCEYAWEALCTLLLYLLGTVS